MFAAVLTLLASAPPAPADAPDPVLVEAVRDLAGLNLDAASQSLAFLGETNAFWLFEPGELAHHIASAGRTARDVGERLEKVAALKGLSKEDAAVIDRLRKVSGLLKKQSEALQTYWDTGVADYGKDADKLGESARKELDAVLDAGKKSGIAPAPREPGKKKD